jgi:hypothetical protein
MTHKKKVDVFERELVKFLNKCIRELQLNNTEIIGTIEITLHKIKNEAIKEQNEK